MRGNNSIGEMPAHSHAEHDSRLIWEFKAGTATELNVVPGDVIRGDWNGLLSGSD